MILAIDVGNTNIVLGVLDGDKKIFVSRLGTNKNATVDECAVNISGILSVHSIDVEKLEGGIVSTVVPPLVRVLRDAVKLIIGKDPIIVGPGLKTGLNIKIDNPSELGSDLVIAAVAAINKYPCPLIIFDLGTATTVSVVDKNKQYLGGAILCGVKTAIDALAEKTAQLPSIDLTAPEKIIGTNTVECMKCGSVLGTSLMIDGLVKKYNNELKSKATVIVTGGIGKVISETCETEIQVDDDLLLEGLKIIYDKNV